MVEGRGLIIQAGALYYTDAHITLCADLTRQVSCQRSYNTEQVEPVGFFYLCALPSHVVSSLLVITTV